MLCMSDAINRTLTHILTQYEKISTDTWPTCHGSSMIIDTYFYVYDINDTITIENPLRQTIINSFLF